MKKKRLLKSIKIGLVFIVFVSFMFSSLGAEFSYKIDEWKGPYSNSDFKLIYKNSGQGIIDIDWIYLDGAYKVDKYILTLKEKVIFIDRVDIKNSAQRHRKPYIIKGTIYGLSSGEYQLIIRRKARSGSLLEVAKEKITVNF